MLAGRGIQFISQLAMVLLLPKVLLPKVYTQLNLLLPIASLGVTLLFGWITGAAGRNVFELLDPENPRSRQTVFLYFGSLFLVLMGVFVIASRFSNSPYRLIPFLLAAIGLRQAVLSILNMSGRHLGFLLANLGFAASLSVFLWLCYLTVHDDLSLYLTIYATLDILVAVIALRAIDLVRFRPLPQLDINVMARYFRYGLPLVVLALPLWVMSVSDRYLLSIWQPSKVVAGYIVSYQFAGSAITIPMSFLVTVIFPRIIRIAKDESEPHALDYTYRLLGYYLRLMPFLAVGTAVAVLLFLRHYYQGYDIHAPVIAVIAIAHAVLGLTHFYNKEFELNGKTMVIARVYSIGALVNLALNIALIPKFGPIAAAGSTLAAYLTLVYLLYRAREYRPQRTSALYPAMGQPATIKVPEQDTNSGISPDKHSGTAGVPSDPGCPGQDPSNTPRSRS
ncbi:MAG: lipopolysaccharide biosynthesis protein [Acidiferrobacterales bacterium]